MGIGLVEGTGDGLVDEACVVVVVDKDTDEWRGHGSPCEISELANEGTLSETGRDVQLWVVVEFGNSRPASWR